MTRQRSEASVPKEFKAIVAHYRAMCPVENTDNQRNTELTKTKLMSHQRIDNEVLNQQIPYLPSPQELIVNSTTSRMTLDIDSNPQRLKIFLGSRIQSMILLQDNNSDETTVLNIMANRRESSRSSNTSSSDQDGHRHFSKI